MLSNISLSFIASNVNPKTAGGVNLGSPVVFAKNVSSKERVKPSFFVTFNI